MKKMTVEIPVCVTIQVPDEWAGKVTMEDVQETLSSIFRGLDGGIQGQVDGVCLWTKRPPVRGDFPEKDWGDPIMFEWSTEYDWAMNELEHYHLRDVDDAFVGIPTEL